MIEHKVAGRDMIKITVKRNVNVREREYLIISSLIFIAQLGVGG